MEQFDNNFGLAAYVGLGHTEQYICVCAYHKIFLANVYTFKALVLAFGIQSFLKNIFSYFFGVWCMEKLFIIF
jgi:hypothetical protein